MEPIKLTDLHPGQRARIAALGAEDALYCRLAALGFRVGRDVDLVRRGLFKGPLHVRVGTTDVMLRRQDADVIAVRLDG